MTQKELLDQVHIYRAQKKLNTWIGEKILKKFKGKKMTPQTYRAIRAFAMMELRSSALPDIDDPTIQVEVIPRDRNVQLSAFKI